MAVRIARALQQLPQRLNLVNNITFKALYSDKSSPQIPRNVIKNFTSAHTQTENGIVYDKKPFKMALQAGKRYTWCLCGRSKTQPFCDGTHRHQQLKITQKPITFEVEESKEYWLCNCKHTNNRPFCDGTHKSPIVQEATAVIRQ